MKALLISITEIGHAMEEVEFVGGLEWYYKTIDCDCIDIVETYGVEAPEGVSYCMVVDDEGLFKENAKVNMIASLLYGYMEHKQFIVGKALICKNEHTAYGTETVGLTDEDVSFIKASIDRLVTAYNNSI